MTSPLNHGLMVTPPYQEGWKLSVFVRKELRLPRIGGLPRLHSHRRRMKPQRHRTNRR
jgi:hypothetical protein